MIHKTLFSEMAKKVFQRGRGLRDPHIMHPEREWLGGLLVMILIFVISATWSAQVYLKNKNVSAAPTTTGEGEAVYREPQVKEALKMASEREAELRNLFGEAPITLPVQEEAQATSTATTTEEMIEEELPVESESDAATSTQEGV